jgi:hypothetical protein
MYGASAKTAGMKSIREIFDDISLSVTSFLGTLSNHRAESEFTDNTNCFVVENHEGVTQVQFVERTSVPPFQVISWERVRHRRFEM